MKVLVTGSDGFIGSHVVEELVRSGHSVRAFALYLSNGSWGWLDTLPAEVLSQIEVVAGDIRDEGFVDQSVLGCDAVVHLAALIAIPYSYVAPNAYVQTNIGGTMNVLNACRRHGVARLVHASTSEVYGTAQFVPISEAHPLQAQSPYSASKMSADHMVDSYFNAFGLPTVVIRPFNTYGPRQSARAVIPTIITQIARGAKRIELGATTPTRDFSYVSDTAKGFIAGMSTHGIEGETFNLGMGTEISIGDTAALIAKTMNTEVEIVQDPARFRPENSEVERLLSNNEKALNTLGWKPLFAGRDGLAEGLEQTINWFLKPENIAHYPRLGYVV